MTITSRFASTFLTPAPALASLALTSVLLTLASLGRCWQQSITLRALRRTRAIPGPQPPLGDPHWRPRSRALLGPNERPPGSRRAGRCAGRTPDETGLRCRSRQPPCEPGALEREDVK